MGLDIADGSCWESGWWQHYDSSAGLVFLSISKNGSN